MTNDGGLSAAAGAGTQTTTQNPQNSTQTASLGQSQNVQTGTASSVLTQHTGIPLHSTTVPTVNLNAATTTATAPNATGKHHGTNPILFGFSALLFVVAVVLFWMTYRPNSVKSTTK